MLIPASLCEGSIFYFYVESPSFFFEHLLESIIVILSVICLSQNMINCGITLMLLSLIIFTSSLPMNFRGAWAFMFCCTNSGKRDTTLSYLFMSITILLIDMFHVAIISLLVSFSWLTELLDDLICMYLIMNCLSICPYNENIYIIWANVFVKVLLSHSVVNWIAWGQAIS